MKTIGVTGNIGSGKTTVCEIFYKLDVPVFTSDMEARKLLTVPSVCKKIFKTFGASVMNGNKVSSDKLAAVVFSDKEKLAKLNAIIHPEVWKMFVKWAKKHKRKAFVIMESALLFESGLAEKLDYIIAVTASVKIRIKRVMARNKISKSDVQKRMDNQLPESTKVKCSDFVIVNDGKKDLNSQVEKAFIKISKLK